MWCIIYYAIYLLCNIKQLKVDPITYKIRTYKLEQTSIFINLSYKYLGSFICCLAYSFIQQVGMYVFS